MRIKNFRDSLEDDHPSLDGSVAKKADYPQVTGAEEVAAQLDRHNARYRELRDQIHSKLKVKTESGDFPEELATSGQENPKFMVSYQ